MEVSIKGPKDGFVEELPTNVALVRKRLRTNSLCYEQFKIGTRSKSRVALLYIEDIIQPEILGEARERLLNFQIDALFSGSQLEEILSDSSSSLFPLIDYTGRPDYVADCLIHGRFAIIVDGSPIAVIAPANLTLLFKTPEDIYLPYYYVTFERILRWIALVISMLLPGFWVALSAFNIDQLPFPLLATVTIARIGLPLPTPLEAFMMMGLFELFREAGARLPKSIGQTVAVVGGIIIGDAAIRAGLASTTMLVVSSLTAVATFTFVNQTLSGSVSVIRLYVLLLSSTLGMYGFVLGTFTIVLYLSKLESFGVPYLSPLSPIKFKDILSALFMKPISKSNLRPEIMQTEDTTRQKRNPS
ncbi:Spore germination protein XA [compost metagenome]